MAARCLFAIGDDGCDPRGYAGRLTWESVT